MTHSGAVPPVPPVSQPTELVPPGGTPLPASEPPAAVTAIDAASSTCEPQPARPATNNVIHVSRMMRSKSNERATGDIRVFCRVFGRAWRAWRIVCRAHVGGRRYGPRERDPTRASDPSLHRRRTPRPSRRRARPQPFSQRLRTHEPREPHHSGRSTRRNPDRSTAQWTGGQSLGRQASARPGVERGNPSPAPTRVVPVPEPARRGRR